jgi:hypothetical protein
MDRVRGAAGGPGAVLPDVAALLGSAPVVAPLSAADGRLTTPERTLDGPAASITTRTTSCDGTAPITIPATVAATVVTTVVVDPVVGTEAFDTRPLTGNDCSPGRVESADSGPVVRRSRPRPIARRARTTCGSNGLPAHRVSSARATAADIGFL